MDCKTAIIGAGAAGMMCAAHAGSGTVILDHAKKPGEKIRISGGGRCNFTNLECAAHAFLSQNPHFCKSALAGYTQWDFIDLVGNHGIKWHEKTLGQLFCNGSAKEIISMLQTQMEEADANLILETSVSTVVKTSDGFDLLLSTGQTLSAKNLVIATGGKSIPKMGATGFAYDVAHQFGLNVTETRPALVPFAFPDKKFAPLSGISTLARVSAGDGHFEEALLFTHRGLSGPAVLQASSYWREGHQISINLAPQTDLIETLKTARQTAGKKQVSTVLSTVLPARLVDHLTSDLELTRRTGDLSDKAISKLANNLHEWRQTPQATEGYRTAEVTLGGIDTDGLSAKTMETKGTPGLYFIGECVDVTGWLGGYNFQWAWSSGWAAGQVV